MAREPARALGPVQAPVQVPAPVLAPAAPQPRLVVVGVVGVVEVSKSLMSATVVVAT